MGHEKSRYPARDHLLEVSFYQAQLRKAVKHQAGGGKMNVPVGNARPYHGKCQLVAVIHYLVDVPLFWSIMATGRIGAREVRSVMRITFRSGIDYH